MNINKLFPSKYLKAADLDGKEYTLTMRVLNPHEQVGAPPQQEEKPVLYFEGAQKGLILNRTNAMTIASLYGPETDNWPGKRVTLFSMKVKAFGAWHDVIRIKEQQPPPPRKQEPEPDSLPGDDIDEASELLDGPPDIDEYEYEPGPDHEPEAPAQNVAERFNAALAYGRDSGKFAAERHLTHAWSKLFKEHNAHKPENASAFSGGMERVCRPARTCSTDQWSRQASGITVGARMIHAQER